MGWYRDLKAEPMAIDPDDYRKECLPEEEPVPADPAKVTITTEF